MRHPRASFLCLLFVPMLTCQVASAQSDSLYDSLKESTIMAVQASGLAIPHAQGITLNLDQLRSLPTLLGTADPLLYAHYLPSMSTQSELESGIHIQGNDHSHNLVASGGVPIYGATHLLGLFSVFNPTHFSQMEYSTRAVAWNRLGGMLDMPLPEQPSSRVRGEASLGLMAVQGTIEVPAGKKFSAKASVRRSFLNLLYGPFLRIEKEQMRYGFTDCNLTLLWQPSPRNRLWLDVYYGDDAVYVNSSKYDAEVSTSWRNGMAALHWEHGSDAGILHQSVYYTGFGLDLALQWTGTTGSLPSYLQTAGYWARWTSGPWLAKLETACHWALPQSPLLEGASNVSFKPQPVQQAWENTLTGQYTLTEGRFSADLLIKGSLYRNPEKSFTARLSPELRAAVDFYRAGRVEAVLGLRHQYLFQTGFSNIGLPTEYWLVASEKHAPQQALATSLSYTLRFGKAGEYILSLEAYHKWLRNQIEYKGTVLDLVNTAYDPEQALLTGSGRTFGLNLSLNKVAGAVTGWISYAWGRSLRSFDHPVYPGEYPASFERIHELDAVVSWDLGRWTLGGTFVAATGTPFTAPEQVYMIAHQLIAQYGPHNGQRLAPYLRLDLSVQYFFDDKRSSGLSFTLYNATGHRNELCYQLRNDDELGYAYAPLDINIRFMPGLCYFYRF